MIQLLPFYQLGDEAALLTALADVPPWAESPARPRGDRGLRSAFRRWSPQSGTLPPALLEPVFDAAGRREWFTRLPPDGQDASAARVAAALHLFALGPREENRHTTAVSFGAACGREPSSGKGAVVSNGRFARLVNAPPDPALRLLALGRAFRHLGAANVRVAGSDAPNLLRFLFTTEPESAVARWAGDYFRMRPIRDEIDHPAEVPTDSDDSSLTLQTS